MRRAVVVLVVGGLCALGLAACTDDPARTPTSTKSTTSQTSPTDPPSSSTPTTPAPPELPEAAKEKTPAGAKAFVRYYVDALNYSWHALDPTSLTSHSNTVCKICRLIAQKISDTRSKGGFQNGGDWSVRKIFALPSEDPASPNYLVKVQISAGSWKESADGRRHRIAGTTVTNEFDLEWTAKGWQTSDVRST